jgi:hypothetical protein
MALNEIDEVSNRTSEGHSAEGYSKGFAEGSLAGIDQVEGKVKIYAVFTRS